MTGGGGGGGAGRAGGRGGGGVGGGAARAWRARGRAAPPQRARVPAPRSRASPALCRCLRYAYRTRPVTPGTYFFRNLLIRGASNPPLDLLDSLRPVSRCAICRNISVGR